jgi:lipopolysaccharide biosynthesis regulator YciM
LGAAALENLVDIYERESDWNKAIEAHRELEVLTGEKSTQVAHYYCELAERARLKGDLDLARRYLKSSVRSETGAFRGKLIRAAIAREDGDYAQAIRLYEQVLETDRRLMADILPELVDCYQQAHRDRELESFLKSLIEKDASIKESLAYAVIRNGLLEPRILMDCVEDYIEHHDILAKLVDIERIYALEPTDREEAVTQVTEALRKLAQAGVRYRCTSCGYSSQRLVWHCPSCKTWESVRPVQAFQLEALVD